MTLWPDGPVIFTMGYQGLTLDAFIAALRAAGVAQLIDVRAVPHSRKPGFSKKALSARLAEAGIRYVGLVALGTPKDGRDAERGGDRERFERIFHAHLAGAEAQAALGDALDAALKETCCLMCYEANPADCHRTIVAEAMAARAPLDIRHLRADDRP